MTPETRPSFRLTPQVIFGLAIVAVGLLMTAGNLHLIDTHAVWRYFPLAIVAVGIAKVMQPDEHSSRMFGWLLIVVGAWLSANLIFNFSFHFWEWWPALLVIVGALMIMRARADGSAAPPPVAAAAPGEWNRPAPDQTMSEFAFWSGKQRKSASPAFKRAELTAIMGGIELDLRSAGTAGEAVIDVFAFWGGIEITVPPDWAVANRVVAIMGGAEDSTSGTQDAKHHLTVRGFAIMGGVEIKTQGRG